MPVRRGLRHASHNPTSSPTCLSPDVGPSSPLWSSSFLSLVPLPQPTLALFYFPEHPNSSDSLLSNLVYTSPVHINHYPHTLLFSAFTFPIPHSLLPFPLLYSLFLYHLILFTRGFLLSIPPLLLHFQLLPVFAFLHFIFKRLSPLYTPLSFIPLLPSSLSVFYILRSRGFLLSIHPFYSILSTSSSGRLFTF